MKNARWLVMSSHEKTPQSNSAGLGLFHFGGGVLPRLNRDYSRGRMAPVKPL